MPGPEKLCGPPGRRLVESPSRFTRGAHGAIPLVIYLSTFLTCATGGCRRGDPTVPTRRLDERYAHEYGRARPALAPRRMATSSASTSTSLCAHICPCDFNTYTGQRVGIPRTSRPFGERWRSGQINLTGAPPLQSSSAVALLRCSHQSRSGHPRRLRVRLRTIPRRRSYDRGQPQQPRRAVLRRIVESGVNRLSIGAQTLDRRGCECLAGCRGRPRRGSGRGRATSGIHECQS